MTEAWRLANNAKLYRQRQKYKQFVLEETLKAAKEYIEIDELGESIIKEINEQGEAKAQERMKVYLREAGEM